MKCFIVLAAVAACVTAAASAAAPCAISQEFFLRHNVSADDSDGPGPVCGGQCCGRGRELRLRSAVRREAEGRASAAIRPIAELLLSTRTTLLDHLTALSHQSQNKTAVLLAQVYRGHAARAHAPLSALYEDIRALLRPAADADVIAGEELGSPPPRDLAASARKFFRDIFPVAYHNILRLAKQFTPEYESCLKDEYDSVQPFGDIPQQLGSSLSRSVEAARALVQALAGGAAALAASEQVIRGMDEACGARLLRAAGCARCRLLDARPCRNYCLNVARGCIGSLVSELEVPWAEYVQSVERMSRTDADAALRALDARVSEAIMHALENHVTLEKKIRQVCGPPSTVELPPPPPPPARPPVAARRDGLRAPPPDAELLQFAASLAASKKLFIVLADKLCNEPDFAHDSNQQCWNGEVVGDYTKSLVASSSLSDQRYNPELQGSVPQGDSRVSSIGDRLRQARQVLVSHSWNGGVPAAEAIMQGDEAGEEGSGSGRNYPDDDATYDAEGSGDDGSGQREIDGKRQFNEETIHSSTPKTSGGTTLRTGYLAITIHLVLLPSVVFFT